MTLTHDELVEAVAKALMPHAFTEGFALWKEGTQEQMRILARAALAAIREASGLDADACEAAAYHCDRSDWRACIAAAALLRALAGEAGDASP